MYRLTMSINVGGYVLYNMTLTPTARFSSLELCDIEYSLSTDINFQNSSQTSEIQPRGELSPKADAVRVRLILPALCKPPPPF